MPPLDRMQNVWLTAFHGPGCRRLLGRFDLVDIIVNIDSICATRTGE